MGIRLEGPALWISYPAARPSIRAGGPGAIQVAGGQLIILGVACGTMGGYPHVAHLISADLDRVGQLAPGDLIQFSTVTLDEARTLDDADEGLTGCYWFGSRAWPETPESEFAMTYLTRRVHVSFCVFCPRPGRQRRACSICALKGWIPPLFGDVGNSLDVPAR